MAASKDYYQVLGVAETATVDEIKKAFRRLAKQYHPDRNPNNAQASERFKEINEAHDVLSDPDKRKRYDQVRRYGAYAGAGRGGGAGAQGSGAVEFDLSDLGSFGGLGDLFSSIFGRRGAEGGGRLDDEDEIETTVTIPFRVAALGGKVPVTLPMAEVCPTCGGSGAVRVEKRLVITVPAGTEDGTKLRLRGQGTKGKGDVVVVLQVEADHFFRRDGLDVIATVPINVAQAMLGTKIKVKTLDGRRVVLRIPPGTQHGQKFRIAGQGIEKNGRRGDQYVEVQVTLPEHLTPEQEAALKAFAEKSGMRY